MKLVTKPTHWCDIANFGDQLTVPLLATLAGIRAELAPIASARIVGVGSILQGLSARPGFDGVVLGTGVMFASSRVDLSRARVLAVRGAHTAARINTKPAALGDPGILADLLLRRRPKPDKALGWLPHYVDKRTSAQVLGRDIVAGQKAHRIDVTRSILDVIEEAARCERIATSSLHGLILADALELPRMWLPHPDVLGSGFKFHDYATSIGQTLQERAWQVAPPAGRRRSRQALLDAFAELAAMVGATVPPRGARV